MARKARLHARDLQILEHLAERRVETLTHLHRRYYDGWTRKSARTRLGALVSNGFLQRETIADQSGRTQSVYMLDLRGIGALRLRSLAGERVRGRVKPFPTTNIPHQLAINRVSDWLGTRLILEHDIGGPGDRRHRADAAYRAAQPDDRGRQLVLVEVDLGHYSRQRILGKARSFLSHPEARSILFLTTTSERAAYIAKTIRDAHGADVLQRIQPLTFTQLRRGDLLDAGTEPHDQPAEVDSLGLVDPLDAV